jgi:hypothetical protein
MEKVYEVEFMNYTNCLNDTVSNGETGIGKTKYIKVGREPFLIKESDFDKYQKYGDGFRIVKFVGNIEKPELKKEILGEWVELPIIPLKYRCGNINCAKGLPEDINPNKIGMKFCPYCGEKKKLE